MSLTQLVRSLFLSTALATLPTVYSCGSEEDSKACVSDTECKGDDRICVDGISVNKQLPSGDLEVDTTKANRFQCYKK